MKRYLLIFLLAISHQLLAQDTVGGIQFHNITFEKALQEAKKENKMVFLHGHAAWCHYCIYMSDSIYTKKEVGDFYNANFVSIKLDLEKEGAELNKRLLSHTFPTLVFFSSDGEVMHRAVGQHPKPLFMQVGKDALNPKVRLHTWQQLYNNGNVSADTAYTYLRKVEMAGMDVQTEALKYLNRLKPEQITTDKNWRIINELYKDVSAPFMTTLISKKSELEKLYGTKTVNNKIIEMYRFEFFLKTRLIDTLGFDRIMQSLKASNLDIKEQVAEYGYMTRAKTKSDWKDYYVRAVPFATKYCMDDSKRLQEIAAVFFEHTKDSMLLIQALPLARRSVELDDSYQNNETLGGILILLKYKEEALLVINHAIEIGKEKKINYRKALLYLDKIEEMN